MVGKKKKRGSPYPSLKKISRIAAKLDKGEKRVKGDARIHLGADFHFISHMLKKSKIKKLAPRTASGKSEKKE